jgi:hypothetical protein
MLLMLLLGAAAALTAQAFVVPSSRFPAVVLGRRGGAPSVSIAAGGGAAAIRGRGLTLFMASKPAEKEKAKAGFDPLSLTGLGEGKKGVLAAAGAKGNKGAAVEGEGEEGGGEEGNNLVYKGMLLVVAMLWGSNFGALKYLDTCGVDVSLLTALRFLLASVALLPSLWGKGTGVLKAGMEVGLWVTLGYITQAIGLETTDVRACVRVYVRDEQEADPLLAI